MYYSKGAGHTGEGRRAGVCPDLVLVHEGGSYVTSPSLVFNMILPRTVSRVPTVVPFGKADYSKVDFHSTVRFTSRESDVVCL